jgi:hypothetical protein
VLRVHFPQIDAVRLGLIVEAAGRSYPLSLVADHRNNIMRTSPQSEG